MPPARPAPDPQAIDLGRKLRAELPEKRRVHQVRPEPAQHRRLERVAPDVEPVVAGALVPRGRAAEQVLGDQGVAAAADAALGQAASKCFGRRRSSSGLGLALSFGV